MHRHTVGPIQIPAGAETIVLAGNPNTGKSVVFNNLSGLYAEVSNYPGTTVEVQQGRLGPDTILDTPGIYGVSSFNDEEKVARDLILGADTVVCVVDAAHLSRDLFLTLQLVDMGVSMIVALNMMDEARTQGIEIDVDALSTLLGVPVFPTVAIKATGMDVLRRGIDQARPGQVHPELAELLPDANLGLSRAERLLLAEGDVTTAVVHGLELGALRDQLYTWRRRRVNEILSSVVIRTSRGVSWRGRIGYWAMTPITGIPLLLVMLVVTYIVLGEGVAVRVVGFTEETLGQGIWEPWIRGIMRSLFEEGSVVETMLTGEFGVMTMTFTYMLGVILPLVIGFYVLMAILEDSGYLPRIAVMADSLLERMGLNGRAVIPMILGFGCVTMATISVRVLGSRRERVIATYLMALAIPCSAQIGVILGILVAMGGGWWLVAYVATIFAVFVVVGTLLGRFTPGDSTDLLMDVPPIRLPQIRNILRKTANKSYMFIREVTVYFTLGSLLLATLQVAGLLERIQGALAPIIEGWLGLPAETATAFVMGFVRRDFGAAGLYQGEDLNIVLTSMQSLVALITITLFVPCIASVMIILKERGTKYVIGAWGGALITAFLVGGVVARVGEVVAR
jgi:ferrous iron transport protein B